MRSIRTVRFATKRLVFWKTLLKGGRRDPGGWDLAPVSVLLIGHRSLPRGGAFCVPNLSKLSGARHPAMLLSTCSPRPFKSWLSGLKLLRSSSSHTCPPFDDAILRSAAMGTPMMFVQRGTDARPTECLGIVSLCEW